MPLPQQHQKNQNEFEPVTSLSHMWPIKVLGLVVTILAVCLIGETVAVLFNLPEAMAGYIPRLR